MAMTPANPFRRLFAYAVDWYVCTMLCGAPLMLVNSMRTGLAEIDTSLPPGAEGYLWGLIAFAVGAAYYLLFPVFWHGQTPGKRLFRLRIVTDGGKTPGAGALALRQLAGVLLLEGAVAFPSQLLRELLARAAGDGAANLVRIAMVALTVISICLGLYTPGRRMLHDFISGTREVSAA
ncbi:RDD family protein [Agathobaculum sp.]|uniref:RDD family protein n=1 Tax=Agathobaculum sp. TaxID=2048138 RepID=UPI002A7F4451|nr:RDD family protein [Agathobaculum sp.]MDY3617667.1 RDD family protein [Agathobaculum sp.]